MKSICSLKIYFTVFQCPMIWAWEGAMNHGQRCFWLACSQSGKDANKLGAPWKWRLANATHKQLHYNPTSAHSPPLFPLEKFLDDAKILVSFCPVTNLDGQHTIFQSRWEDILRVWCVDILLHLLACYRNNMSNMNGQ